MVDEIDEIGEMVGIFELKGPGAPVTLLRFFLSKGFQTYVKVSTVVHAFQIIHTTFSDSENLPLAVHGTYTSVTSVVGKSSHHIVHHLLITQTVSALLRLSLLCQNLTL